MSPRQEPSPAARELAARQPRAFHTATFEGTPNMTPSALPLPASARKGRAIRMARRLCGIAYDRVVWTVDRLFDYRHGTDTSGIVSLERLTVTGESRQHGEAYEPTPTNIFKRAMASLPIRHEDFTFIDFGSGKGRTLLLASHCPFAEVIGVEFAEDLHRIAERNIARYRARGQRCTNIRSICADATQYQLPNTNLVIYIFNSFKEKIVEQILHNVSRIDPDKKIYIVYCEAKFSHIIDSSGLFTSRKSIDIPRIVMRRPGAITSLFVYSR